MRKLLIGLGVVVVVVIAAALVVPSVIDWNRYKGEITTKAREITGRQLAIDGRLDLAVLPTPHLSVNGVRFANIAGGSAPDMVRLKSLDVKIRFWPLLQGHIEVDSITLVEPSILLERLADGRANWQFANGAGVPAGGAPGTPAAGGAQPAVRLDRVRIERGTLVWRDAASGTVERITDVTADLAAGSLSGPFRIKGNLIARGLKMALDASVGALKPETASAMSVALAVPGAKARAEMSGSIVALADKPRLTGKLDVQGRNLASLLAAVSGAPGPAVAAQPFSLSATISGSPAQIAIDDLDAELGKTRASGKATATFGARTTAKASIHVTRIDLDAALAQGAGAAPPSRVKPGSTQPTENRQSPPAAKPFALPGGIDATLDVGIDAVTYDRQNLRDLAVRARLAGGQIDLQRASLLLPGGGEASLTGRLAPVNGRPIFVARLDAQSDNLRLLLDWLGVDVTNVPYDRLRKVAVSADLRGNDQQIQVQRGQLSLDATRIDFATTVLMRARPAFGATLNVGDLNLDAYMPRPAPAHQGQPGKGAAAPSAPPVDRPSPLAALDRFDANVVLRMASLTVNGTAAHDIYFNGTLSHGVLTVRDASVKNVGGASAALSGTVRNFKGFPVFKGKVQADARDVAGLLRLAGVQVPPAARSLGALKLRGSADAQADKVTVDLALDAAGGKATVKGTLGSLQTAPSVDAMLTARDGDLSRLLRTLGGEPGDMRFGALDLSLSAKGDLKHLGLDARVRTAGADLHATGTVSGLAATPVFVVKLAVDHPSTADLVRAFAPGFRPSGGKIGPFHLRAVLNGSNAAYKLASLTVDAGKVALKGSGELTTSGPRPMLTASLSAGVIDLNPFLRGKTATPSSTSSGTRSGPAAGRAAPSDPGERFSAKPIDTAPLGLLDADLSVDAKALIWRQYRVDNPTIRATLKDRLLDVAKVAGKMFDGRFLLNGTLNGHGVPALDGAVTVTQANVGKALFQSGTFDITGGITDFSMNLATRGTSRSAMVAALNGAGKISARNGVVKGFNLKAVSDRLKNLDRAVDFLGLIGSAMSGGQTRFSSLNGTFNIKNGILRTNDLRLVAEDGEGTATGFANLPSWTMDFTGKFRLTEHPKAPPFGMRVTGALDKPRRILKFEELQTYLLQRGIGSLLRKAFPGGAANNGQAAPSPQPGQQQPAPKKRRIEDILPGLLKGIGR